MIKYLSRPTASSSVQNVPRCISFVWQHLSVRNVLWKCCKSVRRVLYVWLQALECACLCVSVVNGPGAPTMTGNDLTSDYGRKDPVPHRLPFPASPLVLSFLLVSSVRPSESFYLCCTVFNRNCWGRRGHQIHETLLSCPVNKWAYWYSI